MHDETVAYLCQHLRWHLDQFIEENQKEAEMMQFVTERRARRACHKDMIYILCDIEAGPKFSQVVKECLKKIDGYSECLPEKGVNP